MICMDTSNNQANNNQTNCAYQYTVKRGDSFYLIAHRHGVQLRDLLAANPDIPPSRLTVGDVLCIPYGDAVQTPAGDRENCETPSTPGNPVYAGNALYPRNPVHPRNAFYPRNPVHPGNAL